MNYIINPSWFYWINVADAAHVAFFVTFIILLIVSFALWFIVLFDWLGGEDFIRVRKVCIVFTVLAILAGIADVFIPTRDTLIEMQIARYATYENAEWTVDAIKSAVDYIVNAIQSVK